MAVKNGLHPQHGAMPQARYLANRVSSGPSVANTNTYGVATGPIAATVDAGQSDDHQGELAAGDERRSGPRICPGLATPSRRAA